MAVHHTMRLEGDRRPTRKAMSVQASPARKASSDL
jgi:hypothetical protein